MNVESEIADYLEENLAETVFVGVMPDDEDSPDRVISIYMTGSAPSYRTMQPDAVIHMPIIQIITREVTYIKSQELAWDVHYEIDGLGNWQLPSNKVMSIQSMQVPFPTGKDSQDRKLFSQNYQLWVDVS